jgi:hypothetical protein
MLYTGRWLRMLLNKENTVKRKSDFLKVFCQFCCIVTEKVAPELDRRTDGATNKMPRRQPANYESFRIAILAHDVELQQAASGDRWQSPYPIFQSLLSRKDPFTGYHKGI